MQNRSGNGYGINRNLCNKMADSQLSQEELELAMQAGQHYRAQRYESCLTTINRLWERRREDPRVLHNKAVARYYLSNLTQTDDFRKTLQQVSEQGSEMGVFDRAVPLFNKALILARLHQYTQATGILEMLYKVESALDVDLSSHVCVLLVELYLTMYQTAKAKALLAFLENKFFDGNIQQTVDKEKGGLGDSVSPEHGGTRGGGDSLKARMHQFHAWLFLIHKSVKQCKKEIKTLTSVTGFSTSAVYLKANLEYIRMNYRKAMKVLASAPKSPLLTDSGECLPSLYLNNLGCIHHQMGKHSLAAHYFSKALEENDSTLNDFPPQDKATPLSGRPLAVLSVNCRHILLYNLGLQHLFLGRPVQAFDFLLEAVQVFHCNPQLWLRLAEACVAAHCVMLKDRVKQQHWKSQTMQVVVGHGSYQKAILVPTQAMHQGSHGSSHSAAMPSPSLGFASICLRNALFLLPSVSSVVAGLQAAASGQSGSGNGNGDGSEGMTADQPFVAALPGPPIRGEAILSLRSSVLACSSYVALNLGDHVMALAYAQELLASPVLSGALRFLGTLYAAEAAIHLGRLQEAVQYLNPEQITDISTAPPPALGGAPDSSGGDNTSCDSKINYGDFPSSVQIAKAVTLLNLASLYCLGQELEQARKVLFQAVTLFSTKLPPQAVLLSAYIELQSGNTQAALQMIKRHQLLPAGRSADKKRRGK